MVSPPPRQHSPGRSTPGRGARATARRGGAPRRASRWHRIVGVGDEALAIGRGAFARRAWGDAFEAFTRAQTRGALAADDVERLALAAGLTGHEDACIEAFERLHQLRLDAGQVLAAARAAFWAAMRLFSLGEMARGSGWVGRAQRLVERDGQDCVECGYLRLPLVFRATASGDYEAARAAAAEAAEIGDRLGDRDLGALGRSFEGRALIRQGRLTEGLRVLDEAMVAVASAELSPLVTGLIYCAVIAACQQSYALDRAREWTRALSGWCEGQPQLVTFAGACMIHRSEILQLGGEWPAALEEVRLASSRLANSRDSRAGDALYQEGELQRLRGELDTAEQSYARASERGRDPQPGLALLRLAQGRGDLAAAATRRALSTTDPLQRARFLPAHVEILLAAGECAEARQAADELGAIAERLGMEILGAIADHARGAVALAEGDARAALQPLRRAQDLWQRVGAPYLCARVRVVMARAFQALGDQDGAGLELEAARKVFLAVGAGPDLAALEAMAGPAAAPAATGAAPSKGSHGLSPRELEVLLLVAAGKTNKVIARELFVSEKTVDRHVSNIFAKLNVPSRAAATAWAYQHRLLG
ncbi:MAG: helix-turn-helix transcriptional regulator [Deltaproteobacteria bacterium]|nr:helix-turn-helix transcriptional regulator [Deltaproteobacteria bacterium]